MRFTTSLSVALSTSSYAVYAHILPRQISSTISSSSIPPSVTTSFPASSTVASTAASTPIVTPLATSTGANTPVFTPTPLTSTPSLSFLSTGPSAVPLVSITASEPTQATHTLNANLIATPGALPPIPGAPALPSWTFVPGTFPALDLVPDTNSSQVQGWILEVQNSGITIPDYAPTVSAGACALNPAAAADASRCWWTCGGCTRPTDITTCPDKLTWGVSYDDGPSPYTPDLLNFMDDNKVTSTFFIVGSRAISRPNILQSEYMAGHQLCVHTWSHPPLTTLTNAQIIAELGWTREAIRQITGVSPNTMRPPYGDIDDRVRAISQAMGMTPIIWTSTGTTEFDTNDWHIPSGQSVYSVIETFEGILETATTLNNGFIVLAHDLYQQTVDLAVGYILPDALARTNPKFNLMSIIECQHKPLGDAYVETNNNVTNPFGGNASPLTGTAAVTATPAGGAGTTGTTTGSQASQTKSAGTADVGLVAPAAVLKAIGVALVAGMGAMIAI